MKKIPVSTAVILGLLLSMVLVSIHQSYYHMAKVPHELYPEQKTVPELDEVKHHNDTNELQLSETKERKAMDGVKIFHNISKEILNQEFSAKDKTYCGPRVTLLGFHKCATTDLSQWFEVAAFSAINTGLFIKELGEMCPRDFMENRTPMFVKSLDITTYGDCPGCLINNQVLRVGPNDVVLHSVAQYIQYLRKDNSRYINTMRNPTDRVLSHYFYCFKQNLRPDYPIYKAGKTTEDIGFDVLHEVVTKTVKSLKECLARYGVTECIVTNLRNYHVEDNFMALIITASCYSAFIREVLKFLPRDDIYFSKMEDYAVHPEIVVPELFKFLGEDADRINMGLANHIKNTGVTVKPVHQKTIDLLDEFFEPFNEELADMIGSKKWKFKRELTHDLKSVP